MWGPTGRAVIQSHYENNEDDDDNTTRKICSRESCSFLCIAIGLQVLVHLSTLVYAIFSSSVLWPHAPSCFSMHIRSLLLRQGLCSCCSLCTNALLPPLYGFISYGPAQLLPLWKGLFWLAVQNISLSPQATLCPIILLVSFLGVCILCSYSLHSCNVPAVPPTAWHIMMMMMINKMFVEWTTKWLEDGQSSYDLLYSWLGDTQSYWKTLPNSLNLFGPQFSYLLNEGAGREQVSANVFKESILGLRVIWSLSQVPNSASVVWKQPGTTCKPKDTLCSNKTLFTEPGTSHGF